eukprot:CAMPEP_0113935920 /NCGR_PEP_ID=MMETSP1339-20121228/2941_1 /TAXON_ID=94617 /ORGANISM="Fibrocapsa japonica" /LENGTH=383 /DNA_ID=CAMNT_0000938215 /DNA_START=61 /DNA_END=1212 /DNA_ORIENTATION=+ /assembly_acc=CAM_ASM_000762
MKVLPALIVLATAQIATCFLTPSYGYVAPSLSTRHTQQLSMSWMDGAGAGSSPAPAPAPAAAPPAPVAEEVYDDAPVVSFASGIKNQDEERRLESMRRQGKLVDEFMLGAVQEQTNNHGPVDYRGFTDKGDSDFDGGDGQVGVVGDGKNNMEEFDRSQVIKASSIVKESKQRQRNAWGTSTGYAEKLKDQGMTKINKYGEDEMKVRRQQLENWSNQQELKRAQNAVVREMAAMEGIDPALANQRSSKDYFGGFSKAQEEEEAWNVYKPETKVDESSFGPVDAGTRPVRAEYSVRTSPGKRTAIDVELKNIVMTYQDYRAAFTPDTSPNFDVQNGVGTMEKRGGAPTMLQIGYTAAGVSAEEVGTLVVDTEEFKWVFKITGSTG